MTDFTVVMLHGAYASSVATTLDVLQAASAIAPRLGSPVPTWRVVSPGGGTVNLSGGLQRDSTRLPRRAEASCWIIPGLGVDQPEALTARLTRDDALATLPVLRRHVQRGGAVAASCSAVFLLQAAGLLSARRVTTSWWLAPALQCLLPDSEVEADRMVCEDGPIITAGAAFAQADLMLHLLHRRFSPALADTVARMLLLDAREAQSPFVIPAVLSHGNELVRQLTLHIEAALPSPPSVTALAAAFAMSSRTLSRHVRAATGQSVLTLVQRVRLNRARQLIESSRLTIEQVAARVGYEDATALRRLMRKATGASPSRFRPPRQPRNGKSP